MGTELISSTVDGNGTVTNEIVVTRVVGGDVDRVRAGLAEALERLGYYVVDEQPLVAKRRTGTCAAYGCTTNVLKVPTTVHVKVQPAGTSTARVTFSYTVRSLIMSRSDRKVLAREVDAAIALAVARDRSGACTRCGTEFVEDSRFCRRCGEPLATYEPAELETLRLAAGSNVATTFVGYGALFVLVGLVFFGLGIFVPAMARNPAKMAMVLTTLAWAFGGLGVISLVSGYVQMRRTLDGGREDREPLPPRRDTGKLPAADGEYVSVTEHTTGLLDPWNERAPEPIPLRRRTGDVN